ncbi:MAG: hypothetical protein EOO73_08600 [Myxococcales bacterium]|nr:MAG: hypothetical protein EOO73_08600 [Myxococcales bacterium]
MRLRSTLGRWVWGSACAALLGACGGAPTLKPTALPKDTAPPPAPKPPKERLLGLLRHIERPAPILDLLPAESLAQLDTRLKALSAEQRDQLLRGELMQAVPLLHLRAGGGDAMALLALASTPAAAEELPLTFESAPQASAEEKLAKVRLLHDLVLRAGLHFLRDRVLDIANASPESLPRVLSDVAWVAGHAERDDVVRAAFETWAASGAPKEAMATLAGLCAKDLDEKCFKEAASSVPETAPERARLAQLEKALASSRDGDPLVKAWALLRLGRYREAQATLAPVASKSKSSLRVAAGLAVAIADGSGCPGLPPQVGSPRLCADAFEVRPGLAPALADMETAWLSQGGRDAASAEGYVGLAHVVPWGSVAAQATDAASLEREFSERYAALSKVLLELPEQKPFAVFAAAMAESITAGLRAKPGERPQIDANRKQELWFGALGVEAAAPRLAVGAVLAGDQPVLQLLPESAPPSLVPARAGLLAWESASGAEPGVVESARAALAEQLTSARDGSVDRSSAVLLLAELDAVAAPSERTHSALARIASQLIGQPLPPELALRAVLDAAGALERLGKLEESLGVLTKAAEIDPLPGKAGEMLALIRVEKLVLAWDAKKDPQRVALGKSLGALQLGPTSASIAFAKDAWASPKALKKGAGSPQSQLGQRLGVRAAELMAKGTLRGTSVSLRFSYFFQTGLVPEVRFDPLFIPLVRPDLIQKAL